MLPLHHDCIDPQPDLRRGQRRRTGADFTGTAYRRCAWITHAQRAIFAIYSVNYKNIRADTLVSTRINFLFSFSAARVTRWVIRFTHKVVDRAFKEVSQDDKAFEFWLFFSALVFRNHAWREAAKFRHNSSGNSPLLSHSLETSCKGFHIISLSLATECS